MLPGGGELLLVFLVVLLLFGGKELPRLARIMGQWSATMKRSLNDVRREFNRISIEEELRQTRDEFMDKEKRQQRMGVQPDPEARRGGPATPGEALETPRPAHGGAARDDSPSASSKPPNDAPPARDVSGSSPSPRKDDPPASSSTPTDDPTSRS